MSKSDLRHRPLGMHAPQDSITAHLLDCIQANARRLAASVAGLDETQLRAPAVPSGWSMLGLLGHVRDSSYFWLHHIVLGHPMDFDDSDDAWDNTPAAPADEVVASLVDTITATCGAVRDTPADAPPGWWPKGAWGGYRQDTVLGVLIHLLADNTAHAGHLDIARELTDGGIWDYSTDAVRVPQGQPPSPPPPSSAQ